MAHGYFAFAEFRFRASIVNPFNAIHEHTRIPQLDERFDALDGIRESSNRRHPRRPWLLASVIAD